MVCSSRTIEQSLLALLGAPGAMDVPSLDDTIRAAAQGCDVAATLDAMKSAAALAGRYLALADLMHYVATLRAKRDAERRKNVRAALTFIGAGFAGAMISQVVTMLFHGD